MNKIQLAEKIVSPQSEQEKEVFIDPITIMVICSVLSAIFDAIRMWRTWRMSKEKTAEQAITKCASNNPLVRRFIKRTLKRLKPEMGTKDVVNHTINIMTNIAQLSPKELLSIMEEK